MSSVSKRETAACNTILELETLNPAPIQGSCVSTGKSVCLSEPILYTENHGSEGSALYCLSRTLLKQLVLTTLSCIFTFYHPVKRRTWQDSGRRQYMSARALFSQMAKGKACLACFVWSVIGPCSNVQYSVQIVETETPILWPPDTKSWLIWKDTDVGKDWGQEEKGMTEDETVGWHHRLNGLEFG